GPALVAAGASVVGINCSTGPSTVLEAVERLARAVDVPVAALPNAGLPREVDGRKMYVASPEYVGEHARRMVEAGARFVGGCCGTTPEHIAAITKYVRAVRKGEGRREKGEGASRFPSPFSPAAPPGGGAGPLPSPAVQLPL